MRLFVYAADVNHRDKCRMYLSPNYYYPGRVYITNGAISVTSELNSLLSALTTNAEEPSSSFPSDAVFILLGSGSTLATQAYDRIFKIASSIKRGKKSLSSSSRSLKKQVTIIFTTLVHSGYLISDVESYVTSLIMEIFVVTSLPMEEYIVDIIGAILSSHAIILSLAITLHLSLLI